MLNTELFVLNGSSSQLLVLLFVSLENMFSIPYSDVKLLRAFPKQILLLFECFTKKFQAQMLTHFYQKQFFSDFDIESSKPFEHAFIV